jgi:penicillin-binding protein 1C
MMIKSAKIARIAKAACAWSAAALSAFLVASWLFIGWTDEGADEFPGGIVLRDSAGRIIRVALGPGDVDCRPHYRASPDDWIVKALVAAEDGTFWSHRGVRPMSALRAAMQNVLSRRRISGASTITMQAVRLIRPHPKSLWWKWKEAVMALKMERAKSKEWIVSQYLNRAPFGSNLVGIESAARGWFGKGAKELGIGEAAMLAGMVQAPTRFRPDRWGDAERRKRAFKRRDYVLGRMKELGYLTDEQYEGARSVEPEVCRSPRPFAAPFFCDWYVSELESRGTVARGGGDFTTSLDADVQLLCERSVASAAEKGGYSAAAVVVRAATGDVVAMAASGDYFGGGDGQVNTALSPRPAGSTLKPFLVALAMERGLATPEQRIVDAPASFRGYRPANFDGKYRGPVTVRDALVLSLNVPFVKLLNDVGVEDFADTLRALGFRHFTEPDESYGLGMAIGNVEVTLLELVRAYAALARGGDGLFTPATSYLVSDMLSGDERAYAALGHVADVASSRFAWKTGTSSAYRDAWTVAWNPEYVVGVWCGHKSGGFGDKTLVGARAAAPVAWGIARQLYPGNDGPWFAEPDGVVRRRICRETGLPASPDCPETEEGRAVRGRSSPRLCDAHRKGPDGSVAARLRGGLSLVKPEEGAHFKLVPGSLDQRVVCQVGEVPPGTALWWFVDGAPVGESVGRAPFPVALSAGEHVVTCATAAGDAASVSVSVE